MLVEVLLNFFLQLGDLLGDCRDNAVEAVMGFPRRSLTTILFHLQHLRERFNAAHQSLQLPDFRGERRPGRGVLRGAKLCDQTGIRFIGFVALQLGGRIAFDAQRIDQ